jgi:hypothetical protein
LPCQNADAHDERATYEDEEEAQMTITTMTSTAASRPRSESPFTLLGAGRSARRQAMWQHVDPTSMAGQQPVIPTNPIFTTVDAAKQGSPPRGAPS